MLDMTQGKPSSLIIRFSIPLVAGNILQQCYNLVDSIVVGQFVGKEALAAVGNSFIIIFLLNSLFMGIGMGATILISQFFGAKQMDKLKAVVDTMYVAMVVGSIIVALVGFFLADPLLAMMKTPEGITFDWSSVYLKTIFIGTLASFGFNVNSAILQGLGDSKTSLLFLAIATVVNIILDLLFVIILDWGVFGVAIATILAQLVAFIFGIWYINRKIKIITIRLRGLDFDWAILNSCMKIGIPAGIQNAVFSLGTIALQRLINGYGPSFMAGYSAAGKIDSFAFMPIAGFSTAISTYVGQNMGAGQIERVKKGVTTTNLLSVGVCLCITAIILPTAQSLMSIFSHETEVLETGVQFLYRIMPLYFVLSLLYVTNAALRGTGETLMPLLSLVVSVIIIRVPAAYIYDYFFGKYDIFWCYATGWILGVIPSLVSWYRGKWQNKRLVS